MIKALEQAIQKVRALPEDKQRLAAEFLEELAAEPSSFPMPAWHREIVEQRIDDDAAESTAGEGFADLRRRLEGGA